MSEEMFGTKVLPIIILTVLSAIFLITGFALNSIANRAAVTPRSSAQLKMIQKLGLENRHVTGDGTRVFRIVGGIFLTVGFMLGIGAWTVYYFVLAN